MSRLLSIIFFLYFNVASAGIYRFSLSSGGVVIIKTPYGISLNQAVTRYESVVLFNFSVHLELYFGEYNQELRFQPESPSEILFEVNQIIDSTNADIVVEQFSITGIEYSILITQMSCVYHFSAFPGAYVDYVDYVQPVFQGFQDTAYPDTKYRMNEACGSSALADADRVFISSPGVSGVLCDQSFINTLPKTRRCGFILTNTNGESKNIYPCRISCGRVFFNTEYRSQHHKSHLTSEQLKNHEQHENIKCRKCGRNFTYLRSLINHLSISISCRK